MKNASLAAAGLCLLALATGANAAGDSTSKAIPSPNIFPFLSTYLGLPANMRDHYHLSYALRSQNARFSDVHMMLKRKSGDVPIAVAANGQMSPLPTLVELTEKTPIMMSAPSGAKFGVELKIAASVDSSKTYDAQGLKIAVDQARTGSKKVAGLMAMMVPDFQSACFEGTSSGTAMLNTGKTIALKLSAKAGDVPAGTPCFTPSEMPAATQITLDRPATAVYIVAK